MATALDSAVLMAWNLDGKEEMAIVLDMITKRDQFLTLLSFLRKKLVEYYLSFIFNFNLEYYYTLMTQLYNILSDFRF